MRISTGGGFGVLFLLACGAQAQTVSSPGTSGSQSNDALQEIVITALRSNTDIQRTPAAVTYITGDALEQQNVIDVRGLQDLVTGARVSPDNTATRFFIRGAGSAVDFYWVPETVAINFNGVYQPRFATLGAFFDIDNIQVLPGPQGVLYGRSAGGGAVTINTKRPSQDPESILNLEYGAYNLIHFEGIENLPINDELAVRAGVNYIKHNGYQSIGSQAQDSVAVRLSALYEPVKDLSVYVWVNYFRDTGTPEVTVYLPYLNKSNPWYVPAVDPETGSSNYGSYLSYDYTVTGADIRYNIDTATLESVTSFLDQSEKSLTKLDGNNQNNDYGQRQYTEDLKIFDASGKSLWYIGGLSWYEANSHANTLFGPDFGTEFPLVKEQNASAFAQLTYLLTPALRFVAGTRYSYDSLQADGTSVFCIGFCLYPPITFDNSWRHLDRKGEVQFDATSDLLLYANVQTGYTPGTFNTYVNIEGLDKNVAPQNLLAYTAGFKQALWDRLATLNVEVYDYRYKDFIIQTINSIVHQPALFNAPHAGVYGLQVDTKFRPTRVDTLSISFAYTHGRYGHFQPDPASPDVYGLQMQYTPDYTATLGYQRRFELPGGAILTAQVSSYISSSFWGQYDEIGDTQQKAYTKTDASLTYRPPGEKWSVGIWGKNLENAAVRTAIASTGFVGANSGSSFVEPPREYGVNFGLHF